MRLTSLKGRSLRGADHFAPRLGRWAELALLVLLAIQLARLALALVTPTGPFGDWHAREPVIPGPQARQALFAAFDPFYRAALGDDGAVQQVTSLPLQLFGTRVNEGSGLGSAIIADEAGAQRSYAVGDEIAPGVTLQGVAYDHVIIDRGGARETLYIDQSGGVSAVVPDPSAPQPGDAWQNPKPVEAEPMTPQTLLSGLTMAPRMENGGVSGIAVGPQSGSDAFARAGFQSGDIIVQVNGQPIRGATDIADLRRDLKPGARLSLMVERGAATVPIALILPDNR